MRAPRVTALIMAMPLLAALGCFSAAVQARLVEAQGDAAITNQDVTSAREQAIQAAVRQALLQTATTVRARSTVSDHELVEDVASVTAAGTVRDVVVLKEWRQDRHYHVLVRAQVVDERRVANEPGPGYRKKVAALQFHVVNRGQVSDLPGIEVDLPRELLRRVENTNRVLAVDGASYYMYGDGRVMVDGKPAMMGEAISRVAKALGVQFVIVGSLRDLGAQTGLSGIFRDFSLRRALTRNGRRLELELALYDGVSGALVSRRYVNEWVSGAGELEQGARLGGAQLQRTPFGRALDATLDQLADGLAQDLDRLPFTARVIRAEGKLVTIDVGGTSLLKVGDALRGFRISPQATREAGSEKFVGYPETPISSLVVRKVQPQLAMGELEVEGVALKAGDIVRLDSQ